MIRTRTAMDMREKMQRMQAFMMKDPQKAMQYMQSLTATTDSVTAAVTASVDDSAKVDKELENHTANFKAAVAKALDPTRAVIKEMIATKTVPSEGDAIIFRDPADTARYNSLQNQLNTDYEKLCVAWWGATGTFAGWLRNYKTYLVNDVIAPDDKIQQSMVAQMVILDSPTGGYRSTATLDGVRRYLDEVYKVYAIRPIGKFGQPGATTR